ncbi:MAG: hypothetical protein MZV70_18005 [Desulfobacterales bacterium]|nr:hypothetical protein [Desulfobacterales bacterium]
MVKYYLNKIRSDESVDIEAIVSDTASGYARPHHVRHYKGCRAPGPVRWP